MEILDDTNHFDIMIQNQYWQIYKIINYFGLKHFFK